MLDASKARTSNNGELRPEAFFEGIRLKTNTTQLGASEVATIIGISMPESHPDERLQCAQYILGLLTSRYPSRPATEYITADVLISAAARGQYDTVSLLCGINGTAVANYYGITSLHAAAYEGHLHIYEVLFPLYGNRISGVTAIFSPLHAACWRHYHDVMHFLITQGADVNAVASLSHTAEKRNVMSQLFPNISFMDSVTPLDIVLNNKLAAPVKVASSTIMLILADAKPTGHEVGLAAQWLHHDLLFGALAAGVELSPQALRLALRNAGQAATPQDLYDVVTLLLQSGAEFQGGEVALAIGLQNQPLADLLLKYHAPLQGGEVTGAIRAQDRHLVDLPSTEIRCAIVERRHY